MKIREDFKGLQSQIATEMGNKISQIDPKSHGDFMTAASDMMRAADVNEDEDVIKPSLKKGKTKNLVGKNKMKTPIGKLFSLGKSVSNEENMTEISKKEIDDMIEESRTSLTEKWSEKYKKSINCNNPKGFSQRAHCQGRKKKETNEEILKGGRADNKTFEDLVKKNKKHGKSISDVEKMLNTQLNKGIKIEMEHTKNKSKAKEIAMDHLFEDPNYYDKLKKIEGKEAMGASSAGGFLGKVAFNPESDFVKRSFKETPKKVETKEATGSSSAGSYVTTAAWAKSTNKKDWRGKSKTQIPGGKFVQVKKKCKKFPYCNQGDINALKLTNEQKLMEAIKKVSKKQGISEELIKQILLFEYNKSK